MSTETRFISEDAGVAPVQYNKGQDLFHRGHHPINAVLRDSGLIDYERGGAAIGITPSGKMILLSTTDIDDMRLEHRFTKNGTAKDGEYTSIPEEDFTVPLEDRIVGEDILKNGNIYLGQFVREVTLPTGDNNFKHLLGVAAWDPTPEQFVHDLLRDFSKYQRMDLLKSGILMHHSALTWTSREMVFVAEPEVRHAISKQPAPVTNDKGDQLYTLKILTAQGKGVEAAKLYHQNFASGPRKGIPNLTRAARRQMISSICEKHKNLTMDEIQNLVEKRFSPTAKLLRQGKSPYTHTLTEDGDVRLKGMPWVKGRLKQAYVATVHGTNKITNLDVFIGVALPTAIGFALWMHENMEHHEELTMAATIAFIGTLGGAAVARVGPLLWTRSHPRFESSIPNDLIHHFWPEGIKRRNIPDQFEMVHPDVLRNLRILTRTELDSLSHMPSNYADEMPPWDILYTLGMQNGPYGSIASFHEVGKQNVVLVREDRKNSDMKIEYWPQLNTAFSRNAASEHLPKTIRDEFTGHEEPIRMVTIERDKMKRKTEYTSTFITPEQYKTLTQEFSQIPGADIYRKHETTASYLIHYPQEKIEGKDHEHEENVWVDDNWAVVASDLAAKAAEVLSKILGPR